MRLLLLLLLFPIAACAQGTFTAATGNPVDVDACINSNAAGNCNPSRHTAVAGDTIVIPNGTWTWGTTQTFVGGSNPGSPCITITGQSQAGTILVASTTGGFINTGIIPTISGCLTRLTNMTMNPGASLGRGQILQFTGACSATTCPQIRVDNIIFGSATNGWPQGIADWMVLTINCFGVIDHNTAFAGSTSFPAGSPWFAAGYPAYLGVQGSSGLLCNPPYGGCGDNSLAQPDNWGSANMLYIEDNNLTFLKGHGWLTDCTNAGCRFVIRFNTINEGNATGHGTETQSRNRTVRAVEMYGNTFTIGALCSGSVHIGDAAFFVSRGGTMLGWGNTGTGFCGTTVPEGGVIELQTFRVGGGGPYHNWANCDGTSPFDTNDAPSSGPAVSAADTITSVSGNVLGTHNTYTANQFAPGTNYYTMFVANRGVVYDIVSNTTNTITVDHAYGAQVGSVAVNDTYYIAATKFNFLGTNSTTSTTGVLTDSGSPGWTTNQWVGFSLHDITQFWGNTIISNTANTITFHHTDPNSGGNVTINAGDKYTITRATVCSDQNGRGAGVYFGGAFAQNPVQAANQALSPVYEWKNTFQGAPASQPTATVYVSNGGGNPSLPSLNANRDWFANTVGQTAQTSPSAPFNGTSGTGYGTLANRPTCVSPACITGVGYFATDQGTWNTSGTSPQCMPSSNCKGFGFGSGVFYTWNGSSWTTYYTPLTYPHPLVTGVPPGPTWVPNRNGRDYVNGGKNGRSYNNGITGANGRKYP